MSTVEESVIQEANRVAVHASLGYAISSLEQCNSSFYSDLYRLLTGSSITFSTSSEENRCQVLVNVLELRLFPYVRLGHIKGSNLAKLDVLTIKHLLDVFSMLLALPALPLEPPVMGNFSRQCCYYSACISCLYDSRYRGS